MALTYQQLLLNATARLAEAGVLSPEVDAWELFSEAFAMQRKDYLLVMRDEAGAKGQAEYERLVALRETRKPLQQILGHTGFMGLEFAVNEHVLAPRQDTELLVEEAAKRLQPGMSMLDLCTGSGCVLISLLHLVQGVTGAGVDISGKALAVAKENAKRNFVHPIWRQGDLFAPVAGGRFDLITANPPYIPTEVISGLMPEVRDFEPRRALDGDADGLAFYRRITAEAPDHLKDGGWLLFEIGVDQKIAVETLLFERGFSDIHCYRDYAGNDRVVAGQFVRENGNR